MEPRAQEQAEGGAEEGLFQDVRLISAIILENCAQRTAVLMLAPLPPGIFGEVRAVLPSSASRTRAMLSFGAVPREAAAHTRAGRSPTAGFASQSRRKRCSLLEHPI